MRTHRKRKWSSLTVNMIPLINVIFLITIFIVMMINFSEVLIKKVALPKADEAKERKDDFKQTIQLTAQSSDTLFLGMTRVGFDDLEHLIRQKVTQPERCTVQFRGEENIPYDTRGVFSHQGTRPSS